MTVWSKGHVANVFVLPYGINWLHDQRDLRLSKWQLLNVCHHFFKRHAFTSCKWRYNLFMFSSYQVRLPKLESLSLIHHFAKFDVRNSCGGGNITFLFCTWHHVTTWSKEYVTLRMEAPQTKSPPYQLWMLQALWE